MGALREEGKATLAGLAGRRREALTGFIEAIRSWKELGLAFEAALAQLTLVNVLGTTDAEARAAAEEARVEFVRVGASSLLDRLAAAGTGGGAPTRLVQDAEVEMSASRE